MRWRLTLLVTATMALVLAGFLIPLGMLVRSVAADRAIADATIEAQSLTALVTAADQSSLRLVVDQLNAATAHQISVFLPDGTVIGAPASRTSSVELAALGHSFSVATPQGREILIAIQGLPAGTAVTRTFVSMAQIRRGVPQTLLGLGLLGAVLLGLGALLADALARSLAHPIGALARVSCRLAVGDMGARAELTGPREVREVATALNRLAGRIQDLLRQERETVADLSHRLRTPLTALHLEVESSCQTAGGIRIRAYVETLERAVTELIEDTRRRGAEPETCDAAEVVAERVAFWSVLAEDQGRAVRAELSASPLPVRVAAADLAASIDALLGNVFAHTPYGTPFTVRTAPRRRGGAVVTIEDAGPGFGEVDPVRRGASGGGSTGLGLDIARQTAEASGGTLWAGRSVDAGGARVVAEFGPPAQVQPPAQTPAGRRHIWPFTGRPTHR